MTPILPLSSTSRVTATIISAILAASIIYVVVQPGHIAHAQELLPTYTAHRNTSEDYYAMSAINATQADTLKSLGSVTGEAYFRGRSDAFKQVADSLSVIELVTP